jgi:phosphomannomutase
MNKFIFDVDGTLTPSRQKINLEFAIWFELFCMANDVYLVSGSDYAKTQEQLGDYLLRWPIFVYSCSGNEKWAKGELISTKEWILPENVRHWMEMKLKNSQFTLRTGNHIEQRSGCVNFSIVGRGATLGERKLYVEYDQKTEERKSIALEFNHLFPELEARLGGETGIDVYPKGWDKSQIIKDFQDTDTIYFFGDKIEPGGNDWPLAHAIGLQRGGSFYVKNWQDTWDRLKYLKKEKIAV